MDARSLLAFGMGVGIEMRDGGLDVTIVRVRPGGAEIAGHRFIDGFREHRGECGAEYSAFLRGHGAGHLTAAVALPRNEIIVRRLALPGVAKKDMPAAIAFQMDALHPYEESDAMHGWVHAGPAGSGGVLLGMLRAEAFEQYVSWFAEAGIAVCSFTFSASALYGARRLFGSASGPCIAVGAPREGGSYEIYGESPARTVFSAEFDVPLDRAVPMAAAELRLPPEVEAGPLDRALPVPRVNPVENDLGRSAVSYAAALVCACPRLAPAVNLLPPARRASHSRAMLIPSAVLALLCALLGLGWAGAAAYQERRYLRRLEAEIARVEPAARKAAALDRDIEQTRARALAVDAFRGRLKKDMDAFGELTRILPPSAWTTSIEITREGVQINGEGDQAGPLLEALDGSPEFRNSEFVSLTRVANVEVFRIRTQRKGVRK